MILDNESVNLLSDDEGIYQDIENENVIGLLRGVDIGAGMGLSVGFLASIGSAAGWDIYTNNEANALELFLIWMGSIGIGTIGGAIAGATIGLSYDGMRFFSKKVKECIREIDPEISREYLPTLV